MHPDAIPAPPIPPLDARGLRLLQQQAHLNQSFLDHLFGSWAWLLTALVRAPRHWLRPRGFDATALIPWSDLATTADGWEATGEEPAFVVPCYLPAGYLRVRAKLHADVAGRMGLFACHTGDPRDTRCLVTAAVQGMVDETWHVRLDRPAIGLRWEPVDGPGRFRIEEFTVEPLTPQRAFGRALANKWQLLNAHGLLGRSFLNAGRLLVTGRLRELASKLYGGLHDGRDEVPAGVCRMYGPATAERAGAPRGDKLSIVYVLKSAGLCGGVKVVLEHVARLYERGHDARVFFLNDPPTWFDRAVPAVQFATPAELQAALSAIRGVKVATWYETAPWVADSLRAGDRGYYLVQDIEESYGRDAAEAERALATYRLGLQPISEGRWVEGQLRERFGLDPAFVSIGLDHQRFRPQPVARRPLRLLTQARTWSGGASAGHRIKGWDIAQAVIARVAELVPDVEIATFSIESAPSLPADVKHVHFQNPSDAELAELYSSAGLFLLTSRHEGFGLTAAEAMACGCPVVATRAQGNEEFCVEGETALLAETDDFDGLARQCARLLTEPELSRELAACAAQRIATYRWDAVIDRVEALFGASKRTQVANGVHDSSAREVVTHRRCVAKRLIFDLHDDGEHPAMPSRHEPRVRCSVIVPTVNDVRLTAQCLASAKRFADAGVEYIVVDDGTLQRATRDELRQACKELGARLVWNRQNLGFSASVNAGMLRARGRIVLLCNNDVVFDRPWLEPLEAAFDDPRIGIVGARLLYPDGTLQHAGMVKEPQSLRFIHQHGRQPADFGPAGQSSLCWSVTGALFVIRREALNDLGGFSTAYGAAWEDVDYCLRAWAKGWRVFYTPAVTAFHLEGGTRGATPDQKARRAARWRDREQHGERVFGRKWAVLRGVDDLATLITHADSQRRAAHPLDEGGPHTLHSPSHPGIDNLEHGGSPSPCPQPRMVSGMSPPRVPTDGSPRTSPRRT